MASRQLHAAAGARVEAAAAAWERSGDARALEGLAAALLAARRTEATIELLGAHPDLVAGDPDLMREWGVALRRARRWSEAAEAFEALARTMEAPPGAWPGADREMAGARAAGAWALAEAIDCRLQERGPAEAAEEVRRLLLLPSVAANPYALALHGRLLMKAGDAASAVGPLLEATAALPEDGSVAAAAAFAVRRVQGAAASMPLLVRALRIRADQRAVLAAAVADAVRLRRVAATRRVLIELARTAPSPGPVWNAVRRLAAAQGDAGGGEARGGRAAAGRRRPKPEPERG